jgi:hypothetical protein
VTIQTTIFIREPAETYHARAGEFLSSHLLADFRTSPLLYRQKLDGLVEEKDTAAFIEGTATHTLVLEGRDRFDAEFVCGGPVNPQTGKPYDVRSKVYKEWAAAQAKTVHTDTVGAKVEQMAAGVQRSELARELLSGGVAEGVVRTEYCGLPCQVRVDWFHLKRGLVDLKTCNDLTWFEVDARRYGYAYQLAFYRAVLAQVLDQLLVPVHLVAVEKKPPFRCGVWLVSSDLLAMAQRENEQAMQHLDYCQQHDVWPTGYEELRVLEYV